MKYALIGEKLGHSYSQVIHEKYFKYKNLHCTYDLVEISKENLAEKLAQMKNEGYRGYNITIPYKVDVMNMCDVVLDEAARIGSVNTVNLVDGKMYGYNTDYHGLKLALYSNNVVIKDKKIVILGTGGAGKSVCALCKDLGCSDITLVSRNPEDDLGYRCITYNDKISGDIIINSTPVGMYPNVENTPFSDFAGFETAVDLIYNPGETRFLKLAKENGLNTVNGLYMLVAQAVYAESIWHGTEIDMEVIDKIYREMRGE